MYLLSASGAFDTILLLLIVWQVLRLVMSLNNRSRNSTAPGPRFTSDPSRPKGEVRIERLEEVHHNLPPVDVEDAEFEVIKEEKPANDKDARG